MGFLVCLGIQIALWQVSYTLSHLPSPRGRQNMKKDEFIFILCIWMFDCMHVCALCVCRAFGGQSRTSFPLKLELQMLRPLPEQ